MADAHQWRNCRSKNDPEVDSRSFIHCIRGPGSCTTDHVTRISMQCQTHVCVNTPRLADPVKPGPKLNPSAGRSPTVFLTLRFAPSLFNAFQSTQTQHLRKQFFLSYRRTHLSELPPSFCSFSSRSPSTFLTIRRERRNKIVFAIVMKFKFLVDLSFAQNIYI